MNGMWFHLLIQTYPSSQVFEAYSMMRYGFGVCVCVCVCVRVCARASIFGCYFCSNNQYHMISGCAVMRSLIPVSWYSDCYFFSLPPCSFFCPPLLFSRHFAPIRSFIYELKRNVYVCFRISSLCSQISFTFYCIQHF